MFRIARWAPMIHTLAPALRVIDGGLPARSAYENWLRAYEAYCRESLNLWLAIWWPSSRR